MDSRRCRLAEAIPTQGRRTSCSLRLARTMNRMGCWASLVQSPPNSAETPNKKLLQVRQAARWLSANEKGRFSDTLTQTALFLLLFPSSTKLIDPAAAAAMMSAAHSKEGRKRERETASIAVSYS